MVWRAGAGAAFGDRCVIRRAGACSLASLLAMAGMALGATQAAAQGIDGYASLTVDSFPAARQESGERHAITELRAKLFAERTLEFGDHFRLTAAGIVEGLAAHRGESVAAATVQPHELHVEARWLHADVRVGMTRIAWGRLDEVQPTDVVNPLDLTRFFFEGRSEARRAMPLARVRWLPSDRFNIEGLYVPWFRRARFDELDDETSAFNLSPKTTCASGGPQPCLPLPRIADEPADSFVHAQGGARASVTTGRVDWSASVYRGYETLPLYEFAGPTMPEMLPIVIERFPRFTMIGGDFETVRGEWGVRGELAAFVVKSLQAAGQPIILAGRSLEGGIGVDRSAGQYRLSGDVLVSSRWATDAATTAQPLDSEVDRVDVSLVAALDRSFAQETRRLRAFAVYNPGEASGFVRVIATISLRDNVSIEGSGGVFAGSGADTFSRLASRDFVYARLKVFF